MYCIYEGFSGAILGKQVYVRAYFQYIEAQVVGYDVRKEKYHVRCKDGSFRKVRLVYIKKEEG